MAKRTPQIEGYHAHVYYDADTKKSAARLRRRIGARFNTVLGRWHDEPIGPHPVGSYQVAFDPDVFAELVPWMALNREDITILVHPETGDDLADHSDHAIWLGESLTLRLERLRQKR